MELDEEVVFGLGGLQLDREQEQEKAEAEAEAAAEGEEDNALESTVPDLTSIVLPVALSHQLLPPSSSTPKLLSSRQSQELHAQLVGGMPLWEASKQGPPSVAAVHIPDVTYHPVVLDEWEDRIIWEPTDDDKYVYSFFYSFTY